MEYRVTARLKGHTNELLSTQINSRGHGRTECICVEDVCFRGYLRTNHKPNLRANNNDFKYNVVSYSVQQNKTQVEK